MNTAEVPERHASEAQLAANRANALKSTGPTSSEGKTKSSMNALKHGCNASAGRILPGEDIAQFEKLHQDYISKLQPQDDCEAAAIAHIVNVEWKMRRMRIIEDCVVELEVINANLDQGFNELTGHFRIAKAVERCIEKGTLPYISQNLNRLSREFSRLMNTFFQLRNACSQPRPPAAPPVEAGSPPVPEKEPEKENVKNEPNPVVTASHLKTEVLGTFEWETRKTEEPKKPAQPEVLKVMHAGQAFPDFI